MPVPATVSPWSTSAPRSTSSSHPQQELGQVWEEVAHLAVRLVMQAALEAEVSESWAATLPCSGRDRPGYRSHRFSATDAAAP